MVQTKILQMTLFQNVILFTNHYGNLQEMLEIASFLKYVDLYLTSDWEAGFTWDTLYLSYCWGGGFQSQSSPYGVVCFVAIRKGWDRELSNRCCVTVTQSSADAQYSFVMGCDVSDRPDQPGQFICDLW
jgi:hypothetical protein